MKHMSMIEVGSGEAHVMIVVGSGEAHVMIEVGSGEAHVNDRGWIW